MQRLEERSGMAPTTPPPTRRTTLTHRRLGAAGAGVTSTGNVLFGCTGIVGTAGEVRVGPFSAEWTGRCAVRCACAAAGEATRPFSAPARPQCPHAPNA